MFKPTKDVDAHQHGFVHHAVKTGVRLDCRTLSEYRQVKFSLCRDEAYGEATVSVGSTKAVCVVRGELSKPYQDRPTEGMLHFNAKTSVKAEIAGLTAGDITRALERSIRESECLDLESLCVVAGASAWAITCDLVLVDFDGNAMDTCILATLAALRAFRRPEVTAVSGVSSEGADGAWRTGTIVKVHTAEERDPLPLGLHQTPLAISISLFKDGQSEREPTLVVDPSAAEEAAQSGSIVYTFNAHSELCGMYKSGEGCGVRVASVVSGSVLAAACARRVHAELETALEELDRFCERKRADRLSQLRVQNRVRWDRAGISDRMADTAGTNTSNENIGAGINRNDPILSYGLVHTEVFTRE